MKVTLSLTQEEIVEILREYISKKTEDLQVGEVRLYVMSKSNFRQKTWEPAALIVKNEPPTNIQEVQEGTEIRGEIDASK